MNFPRRINPGLQLYEALDRTLVLVNLTQPLGGGGRVPQSTSENRPGGQEVSIGFEGYFKQAHSLEVSSLGMRDIDSHYSQFGPHQCGVTTSGVC